MVALVRIGHAAAGEKRSAKEALPAAVGFEHAVVDMVRNGALLPENFKDCEDLFRRGDEERALARRALRRHMVKRERERAPEQLRQALGKGVVRRDDADLPPVERVAV